MGIEIDPKIVDSMNKATKELEKIAEWQRAWPKCPYCGSADMPEVVPEEGEKFILAKAKDNSTGIKITGGITVKIHMCQNCRMLALHP